MTTSAHKPTAGPVLSGRALKIAVTEDYLWMQLEDGRRIEVPLAWFPRLVGATDEQRRNWRLIGRGVGIHWPDIDEDVSVENLLGVGSDLLMYRNGHEPQVDDGSGAASRSPEKRAEPRGRNFGGPRDI